MNEKKEKQIKNKIKAIFSIKEFCYNLANKGFYFEENKENIKKTKNWLEFKLLNKKLEKMFKDLNKNDIKYII